MNRVYICDVSPLMLSQEVYEYYYDRVGGERQKKTDRLKRTEDRARSVGVGALLRFAVEDATELDFDKLTYTAEEGGKPYFEGDPIYFSLSHSGKYAVCAISDSPIGVDIEEKKELPKRIKGRFANDVFEWTKKEAKGKLTGKGFFDDSEDNYVYTFEEYDGYIVTVCSTEKTDGLLTYCLPFPC